MIDDDPAYMVKLVDSFLADAPRLLAKMSLALVQQDPAELMLAAHTLKSLANTFGATALASLSKELENEARAGMLEGAPERVEQAKIAYEQVRPALEALRGASKEWIGY